MAPSSSIPPPLPPSVEEAYRRKCIQLKQRTNEVEEANDAARLRLNRLKRQIEKMRLERAFLLEQLARRTSTNVEDSDGSPSPPPTPKEKPLRIKRGHRKPSLLANIETPPAGGPGATFINQSLHTLSPSSDAFSHSHADGSSQFQTQKFGGSTLATANGMSGKGAPKKPSTAFELYCAAVRPELEEDKKKKPTTTTKKEKEGGDSEEKGEKDKDSSSSTADAIPTGGSGNIDAELARGWKDLPAGRRQEYQEQYEHEMEKYQKEKDAYAANKAKDAAAAASAKDKDKADANRRLREEQEAEDNTPAPQDEDVEMANYESDQETQGEKGDD